MALNFAAVWRAARRRSDPALEARDGPPLDLSSTPADMGAGAGYLADDSLEFA